MLLLYVSLVICVQTGLTDFQSANNRVLIDICAGNIISAQTMGISKLFFPWHSLLIHVACVHWQKQLLLYTAKWKLLFKVSSSDPCLLFRGVLQSIVLGLNGKKNSAGEKPLSALPESLELLDLGILAWRWNVNGLCVFWFCSVCFRKPKRKMLLFSTSQKKLGMFMMPPGMSKETRELMVRLWLWIFLFVKPWGLFREVLAQNLRSLQMFTIALRALFPFASRSMPAMCLQVWGFLWHDLHRFLVVLSLSNTWACMLLLRDWTKSMLLLFLKPIFICLWAGYNAFPNLVPGTGTGPGFC